MGPALELAGHSTGSIGRSTLPTQPAGPGGRRAAGQEQHQGGPGHGSLRSHLRGDPEKVRKEEGQGREKGNGLQVRVRRRRQRQAHSSPQCVDPAQVEGRRGVLTWNRHPGTRTATQTQMLCTVCITTQSTTGYALADTPAAHPSRGPMAVTMVPRVGPTAKS